MPDPNYLTGDYEKTGKVFQESVATRLVRSSMLDAKNHAETERRLDAEKRIDAYEDDFASVLKARISTTFKAPNAEELVKVLDTTNNPLKRIVNEVSVLYTRPPVRNLSDPSATAAWRSVLKRAGAAVVFPRLNRMVNLLNTVLVYVKPGHGSLTLRLVLPSDCTVWPDPNDPTMPLCVEFAECDPAAPNAEPRYHQWDRRPETAGYREYDAKGALVRELPNPYVDATGRQIIPLFAVHREWPTWSFWDQTTGMDVYELTLMIGMWETWINHLIRMDSTQQKWATGQIDTTVEQVGGPGSLLSLRNPDGTPVTVGQFSSQSDWAGLGGQIKRKVENVLGNYGLVLLDTRTSGDPTSGFALTVRSQGLVKIQKAQIPSYEESERTLYNVVSTVCNFERQNDAFPLLRSLPALPPLDQADPTIQFADVEGEKTVEEIKAELDMAEKRISMGLASPITVYIDMHPEATEAEARAAIEKNRADTAELRSAPKPGIPAGDGGGTPDDKPDEPKPAAAGEADPPGGGKSSATTSRPAS